MIGINYNKPPNKDPVMNQPWFCWCCYAQDKEQQDRLRNTLTRKAAARDAGGVSTLVLALQRSFGKKLGGLLRVSLEPIMTLNLHNRSNLSELRPRRQFPIYVDLLLLSIYKIYG